MRTIILYGELASRFGKTHRLAVKNVAEAIRALRANFQGFEKYMCSAQENGIGFRVFVGGHGIGSVNEINDPSGLGEVIRIAPVVMGSSAIAKIIVGAILVAASIFCPPLGGLLGTLVTSAGMYGASLIIGGVSTLLAGPPKEKEDNSSHIFSGPANRAVQGICVPLGYGRMIVGSAVVSAGIETYDQ